MKAALTAKGKIVIPAPIRERHQFRADDKLLIEERNDEIVIRKARPRRKKTLLQWMLDCPVKDFRFDNGSECGEGGR